MQDQSDVVELKRRRVIMRKSAVAIAEGLVDKLKTLRVTKNGSFHKTDKMDLETDMNIIQWLLIDDDTGA